MPKKPHKITTEYTYAELVRLAQIGERVQKELPNLAEILMKQRKKKAKGVVKVGNTTVETVPPKVA